MNIPTGVLPAIRKMKDFERALESTNETIVFLETRLSQLKNMVDYARRVNKNVLIHFDLIHGLKTDEYAMEFLIREIRPDGILSTRNNVIRLAKKHELLAIQRVFLLDNTALENNLELVQRLQPDCIEVLPGIIPKIIQKFHNETKIPVIAGGLITTESEINDAFHAGAIAVSTSNPKLWSS